MLKIILMAVSFVAGIVFTVFAQNNIIPMPIHMQLESGRLNLSSGLVLQTSIFDPISSKSLSAEIDALKGVLKEWNILLHNNAKKGIPVIRLELVAAKDQQSDEAYRLKIDRNGILIAASSPVGIFYGLQTLRQFELANNRIQYATIVDKPAFAWRGFLVDVGRNYQPIDMLKEQIDVMAKYKLNVLHFHFTEDLAWRLASKKYPGLTDASVMRRWEGKYYSEAEFRDLIKYCKQRNILFFPEIDMPGHSAAFKRYFGVDMQSDAGMLYIKELLKEFKETYPELDYLHIGGDEVKITNNNFMPEITKYVEDLGYKMTMGWEPGSNLSANTYRQLWMGGPTVIEEKGDQVYIDSKHLYINHMDPLETVTTLFYRKIGEQTEGNNNLLGATLCAWPDRAVAHPIDMFYQNAVYPGLLTFAERSWRGQGRSLWTANILPKGTRENNDFEEYEVRLLNHKTSYFTDKPFPYVKQMGLVWDLIGPFDNGGDLEAIFPIEEAPFSTAYSAMKQVEGGTVVLRHWWNDVVQGAIDNPSENTTWYARARIYCDQEGERGFWIGFDNLSRSYASDSPDLGTWDNRKSWVKVNNKLIEPPIWKQAGIAGDLEIPYVDEGYSYRAPTNINLKKGWNEVFIKLPVKDFNGKNWQTPVKWMFTFVPVD